METEQFTEAPPPSAVKVGRRAIVLSVVSFRGFVDGNRVDPKDAANLAKRSYDWLRAVGLEEEMSRWEVHVLTSPFGSLSDRDRIDASWLSEAVTVLAWSLGKVELPGCETQCDAAEVANSLGFLQPTDATVLKRAELRPADELHEYNEFVYNLHWRIRDFSLNRRPYDFESLARKAWGEPVSRHGLTIKEKDLCVGGVPIAQADEGDWRTFASITQERHRASNWLIGYDSEDFYEVTADT
jgi:hypothetical protein